MSKAKQMKLYLLRPIDDSSGPWDPWYDKAFGFVIRAESEDRARELAQENGGNEVGYGQYKKLVWTDGTLASCIELTSEGAEEVIIQDFSAA